jgi:hypothetical protein
MRNMTRGAITWPKGKKFAFSVVDDTDCTTLENGPIVYEFLRQLGIRTTKTVWMFHGDTRDDNRRIIGDTCENRAYRDWVLTLQRSGFEIAFHGASWSASTRARIEEALERFRDAFGDWPKILAQHSDTLENESIYWGGKRVSGVNRRLYANVMRFMGKRRDIYFGDVPGNPFFWGDICQSRIQYVRNFVFRDINTLKSCPQMPYRDPERPYVQNWFASTDGPDVNLFCARLSEENLRCLEYERGACIMYTHFGENFVARGSLDSRFVQIMEGLAKKDGWFAPTGELLDYLKQQKGDVQLGPRERARLERRWLWNKLRTGTL